METKLLEEIEGIRNEIKTLGKDFWKIRYEDLRRAFCDEVRALVGIETQGLLDPEMNSIGRSSECKMKEHCFKKVRESIEEGLRRFARGDTAGALLLLSQLEVLIESSERPCLDATCTERVMSLTKDIRILITVFDATLGSKCSRVPSDQPNTTMVKTTTERAPEPLEIEEALMPLSNRWRIILLRLLSRGGMKFTEMSRTLGLRTGHLQFHLRVLARQGYLTVDRGNKTYMITERGMAALSWAEV
ncbi:MAG: winged helix-turn-helix domain-containing protein, partial [Candidatus Methanosuratincola petrocarbonis]